MPHIFNRITLVGMGLMSGSLAAALLRSGFSGTLIGVSRRETLDTAVRMNLISEAYEYADLGSAVSQSDLIVLCTPIGRIIELIRELGQLTQQLNPECIITDIGSTKTMITDCAQQFLPPSVHFIGGHPMAGSEKSGVAASDPFLYQNSICVLTPAPASMAYLDRLEALSTLWTSVGARVMIMSPASHDRIAAAISHLPQMLAVNLVNMVAGLNRQDPNHIPMAAGGFRDMTRIASSGYAVWNDILATNRDEIRHAVNLFIRCLQESMANMDRGNLQNVFEEAAKTRACIPANSKGFLSPLHEILVVVQDKPGVIAGMAVALAGQQINIKDIEVLKVREGEGGTIRLAFENMETARRAVEILKMSGFEAYLRN